MARAAYTEAWAVCEDCEHHGVNVFTIAGTRRESIDKFMRFVEGPEWTDNQWRQWKRKGYRASHVGINEYRFKR